MSQVFQQRLAAINPAAEDRRWRYVPYDQLGDGPTGDGERRGIVLVESSAKAARRPYHRQKLALVLANMRHFALEQAQRGVAVRYVAGDEPYREALAPVIAELGPLRLWRPAERELRHELEPLVAAGDLEIEDNPGWLTTRDQFRRAAGDGPPWRMDAFYRLVRKETGLLMEDGKPAGGKFSFDAENRQPWKGEPPAPEPPTFEPDDVTREVATLVGEKFAEHPGRVDLARLPATREDADRLWSWAVDHCLPAFGPYEDAMSTASRGLFHTRISPLLNLGRLSAREVVQEVAGLDVDLASREGFVRQVLGWREFVRHVHRETDGFRRLADGDDGSSSEPARPSHLDAHQTLPPAFWGTRSGLECLDRVVADVWDEAYSHHIPRLMVLANIATLLDVEPRQLTDWFWTAYLDAYDWVVEPNVLAMGTYAVGELMTTKPYVSGAAYIHRMSDYCSHCRFDPRNDCPITSLYWAFLERHSGKLSGNHRMNLPLGSLRKRSAARKAEDRRIFDDVSQTLAAGDTMTPPESSS